MAPGDGERCVQNGRVQCVSVEQLLSQLAARPNRFQVHAAGALRFRARRERQDGVSLGCGPTATPPAAVAPTVAALPLEPREHLDVAKATQLHEVASSAETWPEEATERGGSQSDISTLSSDPDEEQRDGALDNVARLGGFTRGISSPVSFCSTGELIRESRCGSSPSRRLPQSDVGEEDAWPTRVQELVRGWREARVLAGIGASYVAPAPRRTEGAVLRLAAGAHGRPHPEKAQKGGADSYFIDDLGEAIGIADGVGEWEWRFNVNARAFADELMAGCQDGVAKTRGDIVRMAGGRPLAVLESGYGNTKSFGSSTVLVATLGPAANGRLAVANLGDSTLLVLRLSEVQAPFVGSRKCVRRTKEQQHHFNCPFQLSRLPGPEDFPQLVSEGKARLVKAIRSNPDPRIDLPTDADCYDIPVQAGDLVLIGTDGVFDNLYEHELCEVAASATSPAEVPSPDEGGDCKIVATDPAAIAEAVVLMAFHRSLDRSAKTPFGDHSREAGLYHLGGKMDDITCVCAWIT